MACFSCFVFHVWILVVQVGGAFSVWSFYEYQTVTTLFIGGVFLLTYVGICSSIRPCTITSSQCGWALLWNWEGLTVLRLQDICQIQLEWTSEPKVSCVGMTNVVRERKTRSSSMTVQWMCHGQPCRSRSLDSWESLQLMKKNRKNNLTNTLVLLHCDEKWVSKSQFWFSESLLMKLC